MMVQGNKAIVIQGQCAPGYKVLARCVLKIFFHDISAWFKLSSGGVLASAGQAGCLSMSQGYFKVCLIHPTLSRQKVNSGLPFSWFLFMTCMLYSNLPDKKNDHFFGGFTL